MDKTVVLFYKRAYNVIKEVEDTTIQKLIACEIESPLLFS